jgi:hypothetical protein
MLASLELYREYNSPDMVRARSEAWDYLINEYPEVQAPWRELWKGGRFYACLRILGEGGWVFLMSGVGPTQHIDNKNV